MIAGCSCQPAIFIFYLSFKSKRMQDDSSLFSLSIDTATKAHLSETARWARFLAIVGFVFLALTVFSGIYVSVTLNRFTSMDSTAGMLGAASAGVAVMYLFMAAVAFFPLLFTFRFASQMREALNRNDQALLNASFQNLKIFYRYLGIVTIISLVLMALSLIFGLAGLALS
jgi:hypothetical protein